MNETNVTLNQSCPRISEDELTEFEHQLKVSLPADYREFLLAYNRGDLVGKDIKPCRVLYLTAENPDMLKRRLNTH